MQARRPAPIGARTVHFRKSEREAARVFADTSELSPNPRLAAEMRTFASRPSENRDLPAFSVRTRHDSGAFAYQFEGGSYRPHKSRFWAWVRSR
jgi:hypothetical protein